MALLFILQIMILFISIKHAIRHPFNIIFLNIVFSCVFFFIPAWAWVFDKKDFSYSFRYFTSIASGIDNVGPMFIATFITFALLIGSLIGNYTIKTVKSDQIQLITVNKLYKPVIYIAILGWLFLFMFLFKTSGMSIYHFITPTSKADIFPSYYVKNLYLGIPLVIGVMVYLKNNKFNKWSVLWIIIALSVSISTSQRRDAMVIFLFLVAFYFIIEKNKIYLKYSVKQLVSLIIFVIVGTSLVPVLWWARVWYQMSSSGDILFKPWEHRGYFEVLFGGQSTGFPTLLLAYEWIKTDGLNFGQSILNIITIPIPRSLWPNKPITPDDLMQDRFLLDTNPSLFLINELYLNFGLMAIPFSFVIGWVSVIVYKKFVGSSYFIKRLFIVITFSHLATLFKNGFSIFIINVGFTTLLFYFMFILAFSFHNKYKEISS